MTDDQYDEGLEYLFRCLLPSYCLDAQVEDHCLQLKYPEVEHQFLVLNFLVIAGSGTNQRFVLLTISSLDPVPTYTQSAPIYS